MFGQNEYLKLLFCFLVLYQWVQCGKHHRRHMGHASLQMTPRANLRHNTEDYNQVTSTGGDSAEAGDDAATHAPIGLNDDDDTANGVQNDRGNDDDEVDDIQLIVAGRGSVESGADAGTVAPTGRDVDDTANEVLNDRGHDDDNESLHNDLSKSKDYCWIKVRSAYHFRNMDELFEIPSSTLDGYKTLVYSPNFDEVMLKKMLETRSIAERTRQKFGAAHMVPAGLNLGGYEMVRLPTSVIFFHRLKLRNDTRFSVDFLHNDLKEMTLKVHISLHDLHLAGDYERAISDARLKNTLFYRPTSGQMDFLLKNVQYKMEGRYRLLHDQLHIEHVISEMSPEAVAVKYEADNMKELVKLDKPVINKYLIRIQNDLDSWLQDYFNDFLTFYGVNGATPDNKYISYQNSRTIELNRFADEVLEATRDRIRDQNLTAVVIPSFTLFALNGLQVKLTNGAVYGLETVHRQSAGTGRCRKWERLVTAVVGFSLLKVEYDYEIFATTGLPSLFGKLVLTANGQTARMDVVAVKESNIIDLHFRPLKEPPSQTLTVAGPANRIIGNFKHLLEHQITAIMTNCLFLEIENLGSITQCHPRSLSRQD